MPSGNTQVHLRQRLYAGWGILTIYSLFLAYRIYCNTTEEQMLSSYLEGLRDLPLMARRIGALALGSLGESMWFVPVGVGAALVVGTRSGRLRYLPARLPALAMGAALTLLVCVPRLAASRHSAGVVGLAFPLLGCLLGGWAGTTWLRGWHARLWFLPKVALLGLTMVLVTGAALWLCLENKPFPFEAVQLTPGERQRLTLLVRGKSPNSLKEDQTHTLRLMEHDVNLLLSWCLSGKSQKPKAMVRLRQDSLTLLTSCPVPWRDGRFHYLNLAVAGSAGITNGVLRMRADRCQIGSMELSPWILHRLSPLAASLLSHNRHVQPFLKATGEMVIEPNAIQFTYGPVDLLAKRHARLPRSPLANEALLAATRIQVDHLLLLFAAAPLSDDSVPSFNLCLTTAFALAHDRAAQHDPVTENQAAILALGILLGHPGVEDLLGPVLTDENRDEAQQISSRVTLYGRSDWTRHFCLSAALVLLADETVSKACGLLKEKLDTEENGSGFSFTDLLADRAGTALAVRATRDEATARALQDRLRHGFGVEDVCPPPDDLPEGISAADLQSRYGGVGGEGYRRLAEEIQRRVAACAVYR